MLYLAVHCPRFMIVQCKQGVLLATVGQCTAYDAVGDERAGAVHLPLQHVSFTPSRS